MSQKVNTCTSMSFPMVAYLPNSWVSLMVHIKVIQILVSQGILFFFDICMSISLKLELALEQTTLDN